MQYPAQASPNGEALAYQGNGPFAGALGSLFPNSHLSQRTGAGWQTSELTPATNQGTLNSGVGAAKTQYTFSEDLSQLVVKVPGVALTNVPQGDEGLFNLFLRAPDGSYSLLNTSPPSELPPEGSECYLVEQCFIEQDLPTFAGASSDFRHVIFETDDSLLGTGAPSGFVHNLYESLGGHLHLVGVLPDDTIAPTGASAGGGGGFPFEGQWEAVKHTISSDGSRIAFQASADGGTPEPAQAGMTEIYDRLGGLRTVEVSKPEAGSKPANSSPQPAQFGTATTDGSQVFFTSTAELTTASNTGSTDNSSDLYRYDVGTDVLTDLTVDTNPVDALSGAGVKGVVGASSDGTYIYFVADGQLVNKQGVDEQPNLYVWHEDPTTHATQLQFIATLNGSDSRDWTSRLFEQQAYLTPDGEHLAFMSRNRLTGYDNTDRTTHTADSEVYEYNAQTQTLVCPSCDPSGAQPAGSAFIGATLEHLASTAFYQPRIVSDNGGRLFFSSPDQLAAGAISPYSKIYEYEQPGVGTCESSSGCTYLISSGASGGHEAEDVFLDADKTGENVFFATASRLTPTTDEDGLFDVYDARVDGGFAPPPTQVDCTDCTSTVTPGSPPSPLPLPASQLIVGSGSTNAPTSIPLSPKGNSAKPKPLSCRAKAKHIKNSRLRTRTLRRCSQPSHKKAHRKAGR